MPQQRLGPVLLRRRERRVNRLDESRKLFSRAGEQVPACSEADEHNAVIEGAALASDESESLEIPHGA